MNFCYLTEGEQIERYADLRKEYEALKKKVQSLQDEYFIHC